MSGSDLFPTTTGKSQRGGDRSALRELVESITDDFFPELAGVEREQHIRDSLEFADAKAASIRLSRRAREAKAGVKQRRPKSKKRSADASSLLARIDTIE